MLLAGSGNPGPFPVARREALTAVVGDQNSLAGVTMPVKLELTLGLSATASKNVSLLTDIHTIASNTATMRAVYDALVKDVKRGVREYTSSFGRLAIMYVGESQIVPASLQSHVLPLHCSDLRSIIRSDTGDTSLVSAARDVAIDVSYGSKTHFSCVSSIYPGNGTREILSLLNEGPEEGGFAQRIIKVCKEDLVEGVGEGQHASHCLQAAVFIGVVGGPMAVLSRDTFSDVPGCRGPLVLRVHVIEGTDAAGAPLGASHDQMLALAEQYLAVRF